MAQALKALFSHAPKKAFLLPLLAGLLASLTGLGLMGAGAWLIARAAQQPPLYALALGVTCVRACGLFRAVFRYLERYLAHKLAFRAFCQLQQLVYTKAHALLPLKTGALAQGLWLEHLTRDCSQLRDAYVRALLPLGLAFLITLAFSLALYAYHPSLSLTLMLGFLSMLSLGYLLIREPRESAAKAAYRQELIEMAAGNMELQAAGSVAPALARLSRSACSLQSQQEKEALRHYHAELLFSLLKYLTFMLLVYQLHMLVPSQMDYIGLAVWLLLLLTLCQDYSSLFPALQQLKTAKAAAKAFESASPASIKPEPARDCLLKAQDISFGYSTAAPLFEGLSFAIHPHEHTVITGESGRGKTTLACLLAGLYQPDRGSISLSALPAGNLQGCFIFSGSIRENFLRLHPKLGEDEMLLCLETAQLSELIGTLPQGLDTPLDAGGSNLSGGEASRLLTALALASPAPLLILDEPTAGLDTKTASRLLDALFQRAARQQQTLLVITHDMDIRDRFAQIIKL